MYGIPYPMFAISTKCPGLFTWKESQEARAVWSIELWVVDDLWENQLRDVDEILLLSWDSDEVTLTYDVQARIYPCSQKRHVGTYRPVQLIHLAEIFEDHGYLKR